MRNNCVYVCIYVLKYNVYICWSCCHKAGTCCEDGKQRVLGLVVVPAAVGFTATERARPWCMAAHFEAFLFATCNL
jgi:hypothetical protein